MNIRVGYIPYLNMVPFHHGFGPEPMEAAGRRYEFQSISPRALGLAAEKGVIDVGALSLVDWVRSSSQYEPIGRYGIGVRKEAQSVLLFSNRGMPRLQGLCAVTDETSTSFRLLQLLLEVRYGRSNIRYERIASSTLYDGGADALLLIGDEAMQAQKQGIKGLSTVTDLGEEWLKWQGTPFVFARWAIRRALRQDVKDFVEQSIQKSLKINDLHNLELASKEAAQRQLSLRDVLDYWNGFAYELNSEHEWSIRLFTELLEKACLTA